jgi:hypothetical protein
MCSYANTAGTTGFKCTGKGECTTTAKDSCTEPTPTPTPAPVTVTPAPTECGARTSCSSCTEKLGCGWCVANDFKVCIATASNTASVSGSTTCTNKNGIWYEKTCTASVTPAPVTSTPNDTPKPTEKVVNTVTITGTVDKTTTVDRTVAEKVASAIQKTVADALKIDQSLVTVDVVTSTKDDGSTSFTVSIKVSSSTVSSDKFASGVSTITSDSIVSSLSTQGVPVQPGSVNIQNNNQNSFANEVVVALLLLLAVVLL